MQDVIWTFGSLTILLNSSSSAASHSSLKVSRSGGQYPWRRARSITELMLWRSDALVRPRLNIRFFAASTKSCSVRILSAL